MCANTTAKYNMSIIVLYMIFIVSFLYDKHYDIIGILTSIAFAVLFPLSIRKEPKQTDGKRLKSLLFACTFMIGFPCALKITEFLTNKSFQADGWLVVLTGIALQSAHYIISVRRENQNPKICFKRLLHLRCRYRFQQRIYNTAYYQRFIIQTLTLKRKTMEKNIEHKVKPLTKKSRELYREDMPPPILPLSP